MTKHTQIHPINFSLPELYKHYTHIHIPRYTQDLQSVTFLANLDFVTNKSNLRLRYHKT